MSKMRAFCMPKWGIEMVEGTIAEWMKSEGESFSRGDVLCLIETDKITNEVEAEKDGVVLRIVEQPGEEPLPVGALLGVFGDSDADKEAVDGFIASFKPAAGSEAEKRLTDNPDPNDVASAELEDESDDAQKGGTVEKKPVKIETNRPISPKALELAEAEAVDISQIEGSGPDGRITYQDVHQHIRAPASPSLRGTTVLPEDDLAILASPLARRIASLNDIDLGKLDGTGPRGRICKADVLALVEKARPSAPGSGAGPFELVANDPQVTAFDKIRKVVARRLTAAKQDLPHFYLRISVRADEMLAFRKTANLVTGTRASVNDYIVMAAAKALARHPEVNVQVHGEEIHSFPHADVSVAVASPKGLVTPIVRQADRMSISQIAEATSGLIGKAQEGRLGFEDMEGGTFTVSNLGMFGIENFDAIINPPQAAILAVGASREVPVRRDNGQIGFEQQISLTLSVDHRAIDGAAGAQFLETLKGFLESPESMFA